MILLRLQFLDDLYTDKDCGFWKDFGIASNSKKRLEGDVQDEVHALRLAEDSSRHKLSLLSRLCGSASQRRITLFDPDIAYLAVLEDIENEPDLSVTPMTGSTCTAVG